LIFAVAACGGSLADAGDGGDAAPPDSPIDHQTIPTGAVTTFAVHDVFMGESDRQGVPSTTAWKNFGRNVDGLVTTKSSTDVCTLTAGAPLANQVDGNNGIDNAWGAVIMPIIQTASSLPTPSATVSQAIQAGGSTMLIQLIGLSSDPSQTSSGLGAQVFMGAPDQDAGPPAFDSTTDWPVASTSLKDGVTIVGGALAQFNASSISNGTFDSGDSAGTVLWNMTFQGVPLILVIHAPRITFDHTTASDLVNGTISGVLDAQEFVSALQAVAGRISQSLCGPAFDGIAQQIKQANDILVNGTNQAGQACTGISIGLGFNAKLVANPTTVAQIVTPPNPCQ
jgi:hypothetical protein